MLQILNFMDFVENYALMTFQKLKNAYICNRFSKA